MAQYLVRKQGIPVLARSRNDAAAPWRCTLFAKYSDTQEQASLFLHFSIPVSGFSQDQTFTLIYDADNLVPGVNSIKSTTIPLPQDQLDQVARSGNPQLRVLALTVKQPCPISCPQTTGILVPKIGFEVPFHQLRKIAQATEIDVLLDYNWVHAGNRALLDKLIEHPEELAGLAEKGKYTKRHKRVDWTIFKPIDQEEPPPYISASHKRPREGTGSPPRYPSPKRTLLDPALFPGSPTEKATTTTQSPSPRPQSPHVLVTPDMQEAVNKAVNKAVASYLPTALKTHLETLFDQMVASYLPTALTTQVETLFDQTVEYAHELRNQADGEFEDVMAEHKIDIAGIKDDNIDEMNRVMTDKLYELKEQAQDIVDDAVEKMQDGAIEAYDRIDGKLIAMLDEHDTYLRRQRELSYTRILDEERSRRRRYSFSTRGQRSMSLPGFSSSSMLRR